MAEKKKSKPAPARKGRGCPSTVGALTKALERAKAHAKVETAKKRAGKKVAELLKKKAAAKKTSAFERAAKKLTAIWEEKPKRKTKPSPLAYNELGKPITWHGQHLTIAEVNRKLAGR